MAEYIERDEAIRKTLEACVKVVGHGISQIEAVDIVEIMETIPTADVVEVVRCKDCKYAVELDKNCNINRTAYRNCTLWRGEETTNVWHKYKKYYKDYSIVSLDDYCSSGERRETNAE